MGSRASLAALRADSLLRRPPASTCDSTSAQPPPPLRTPSPTLRSHNVRHCLVRLQASFLALPYARDAPANPGLSSLIKRNYVFLTTVFVGAFAVQMSFDSASDKIWDSVNKGRQWKDIKHKYVEASDDE
ncbi:ubiquinol-cytochrome c reductase [Diplodia corticola]|uniref:Complex III subunit 9 n=1 Tax=Diplodia corticola TaxID=236234 RepID=A0A1J9R9A4_9PEZI|nr:ubiquinol-cytochrome c reductase [Diplodia corticola]OJD37128.1 ubiquinol-cytochrome c reductase [Diplodia corticola]